MCNDNTSWAFAESMISAYQMSFNKEVFYDMLKVHNILYYDHGGGAFEGIRFYNGRVFKLKEHIDRLFDSSKAIQLTVRIDEWAG